MTQAGDLLLAQMTVYDANASIAAPGGWQKVRTDTLLNALTQSIYYKIATASEPASYTWEYSSSKERNGKTEAAGGIVVYGGVDSVQPISAHSGQASSGTNLITAPSITTTAVNEMVVFFGGTTASSAPLVPPPGMTKRFEQVTANTAISAIGTDELVLAAGATGERTANGSGIGGVGQLVALRPAP